MKISKSQLQKIVSDLANKYIEEGKGDVSKKMRQRKAQNKKKDRIKRQDLEKYTLRQLGKLSVINDTTIEIRIDNDKAPVDKLDSHAMFVDALDKEGLTYEEVEETLGEDA